MRLDEIRKCVVYNGEQARGFDPPIVCFAWFGFFRARACWFRFPRLPRRRYRPAAVPEFNWRR